MTELELDQLMSRLAGGDRQAFDPLFRALWPRALAAAGRRLEPGAAADAAQSAMVRVLSRAPEFTRGAPVLPWFYGVLANEVRAVLRKSRRHDDLEGVGDLPDRRDPEGLSIEREIREALHRALESLDPQSAEAIAVLLGQRERPNLEEAAFRKRVSRAYAKLRILLGAHRDS